MYLFNNETGSDIRVGSYKNTALADLVCNAPDEAKAKPGSGIYTRFLPIDVCYYYDNSSSVYNVSCDDVGTAFPSFTLVMDTTASMEYFLYNFNDVARNLVSRLNATSVNVTRQYTLMEFNDPSVGPLRVTCSPTEFLNAIYNLHAYDGGDCSEYAMTGLLKALEVSPLGSLVVLVTDASAKDSGHTDTVNQIFSLLRSLQVKVFIIGSHPCGSMSSYDFQIYKDIAAFSYGHVFQTSYIGPQTAELLNFFLKLPVDSTSRLFSVDKDTYYGANFSVPSNLTALIISQSGSIYSMRLNNPSGAVQNLTTIMSESWGSVFYLKNPRPGTWAITVYGSGPYSIRIEGYKAFCETCNSNAACKKDLLDYTCVCNEGFSGDGFSCYDIDECSYYGYYSNDKCSYYGYCINTYGSYYCNCNTGFTWDNATCVDVDECSSPSLNNCDPAATCVNYFGSYSCYCPEGYYGNGYKCEVDECTRDVCGFGRECIKFTGSHNCTDPCFTYTTLNDPTRSTSYYDYYYYYYYYSYYGRSDYYLSGWYRFEGSGGSRLANFCPSEGSCYIRYPMWMNGTHPVPSDGIVNRTICTSYSGYCCSFTSDIKIKACPGGFYVYKFSTPPVYYSGYCTDPVTIPGSCSCADNEECIAVGGRYSCYCKNHSSPSALENIRPVLSCGNQEIKASFEKCDLQKFNLNIQNIHLKDSYCKGFPDFNTTNIISVVSILKNGVCGNVLVNNGTHVIYKNTIFLSKDTGASLGGEDILKINYSCVYLLDIHVSLDTALQPFSNSVIVDINGTGTLEATMALYKDSSYTSPFEGSAVLLTSTTNLFIGIILKIADVSQYAVLMKNCYATPSVNSTIKYEIIKDSCPSKQDSTINVMENGVSTKGRFSVQLFGYIKDLDVVYLHCDIHLCNSNCKPLIHHPALE
ncbi:uromodulin-like, partial [Bufo gargarizans]|uniref:uromodulin-like n=1 Tax=Bufo gargarizans TaxID=30331 RepID=UPI001CF5964D